jgi:hypothetical protein
MKYKISSKYCYYQDEIVDMYFINNVPFTFEDIPQIMQDDPYIQMEASNNPEYSPEELYKTSFYLIDEECHPCLFPVDLENPEDMPPVD